MKTIADGHYYIASHQGLLQAADQWQHASVLGIDTEFIRVDTFYPIPALIQVSNGQQCWLVDVLAIKDLSPLTAVLTAPTITKVVHAASEDLEVFDRLLGTLPSPLFDTQTAAALCGHGSSIGYGRLVQTVLDIALAKDQCRSDWLARPLSHEQQHYACLDVLYLPALHQHLMQILEQQQRTTWMREENQYQIQRFQEQRNAIYNIEKITNAWKLRQEERKRLWHLVLGRDALARQHNKSRNHIAKDFVLLEMAQRPPSHMAALYNMDGLHHSSVRQFGTQLIQLAQNVPSDIMLPNINTPLSKSENDFVKKLRAVTEHIADSLQVPPEFLSKKQEMEHLVRQHLGGIRVGQLILPDRFHGWRKAVIADALCDEMLRWG